MRTLTRGVRPIATKMRISYEAEEKKVSTKKLRLKSGKMKEKIINNNI